MRTERLAAGLLAGLALCFPWPARAGAVAWQMSGTIELVSDTVIPGQYGDGAQAILDADLAAAGITTGVPWSARVSFDPDAAGAELDTGLVQFSAAGARFDLTLGGYSAFSTPETNGEAVLLSGAQGNGLALLGAITSTSPDVFADSAKLFLAGLTDGTFPADSLPADPPDLGALAPIGSDVGRGELSGTHFALFGHVLVPPSATVILFEGPDYVPAGFTISGSIAEIERVPEPSAPSLAAAGLAILTWAASRPRSGRAGAAARPGS